MVDVREGYKKTEVGVIPKEWEVVGLADAVDFLDGKRKPIKSSDRKSGDYPYYGASGIIDFVNDYIFDDELILLGEDGENILSRNLPLAFIVKGKVWVNNHAHVMKPKTSFDIRYVTEFLESLDYRLLNSGTAQPKLNKQSCYKIIIPKPSLTEQRAIATALSDVDALITSLDKLIEKKKMMKQGAMQELLTGKTRLKGFGDGVGYKQTEVGVIPEDWEVKMLPDVINFIHGKAHERNIDEFGKYVVVNSKFISSEGAVVKHSNENFCPAKVGDVLTVLSDLPNGKALAKCYYVNEDDKYAVNQRICIWRSKKPSAEFLFFILNRNKYFLKFDDGVTQTHILNHHIKKCPISLPPTIDEQNAIASTLFSIISEINSLVSKRDKYKQIKQGMMQELLTGKTRLV